MATRKKTYDEAPHERDASVLTMRSARKHADPARSFRKWARNEHGKRTRDQLSPKLAVIVHGPV